MSVDPINLLAFLGMAIVTYVTRIAGLALAGRLSLSPRAQAAFDAIPPAVLIAVRDSAHGDADMLDLVARDASDPKQILDLSDAIRGLPSGLSTVWIDGGLVVPMSDLAALG